MEFDATSLYPSAVYWIYKINEVKCVFYTNHMKKEIAIRFTQK